MKKKGQKQPVSSKKLKQQELEDLEHRISQEIGSFLVLNEEGSRKAFETARQKASSDINKFAAEMQKMARDMGQEYQEAVDEFIESAKEILHTTDDYVDQSTVFDHYKATKDLEDKLKEKERRKSS